MIDKYIYISGPMRGYPDRNFPEFFKAEVKLSGNGYKVLNPARNPEMRNLGDYIDVDLAFIRGCDAIYLLEGWEKSVGAVLEVAYCIYLSKEIMRHPLAINEKLVFPNLY